MNKSVKCFLMSISLTIAFLLSPQSASGQATIKLEKGAGRKTAAPAADANSKIVKPLDQTEQHRPIVLIQPRAQTSSGSTDSAKAKNQTTEAQTQATMAPECSWALLLLNEVGPFHIISTGIPCLGCRIPNELSQSTAGVLGFSHSPSGPWSETLTVYTQLNFSGNGTSDIFYIKGQATGNSTFHAESFWASNSVDFQVVPCACPEIPIVP